MHPDQVHRMLGFKQVIVSCWGIDDESLNAGYVQLLNELVPATPLRLQEEAFSLIGETAALCIKLSKQETSKLHQLLLKIVVMHW